jgi:hypothetical protein
MEIAFHLGAHATDEGLLLRTLIANRDSLRLRGVAVPDPAVYRDLLRDAIAALGDRPAAEGSGNVLLDRIVEDEGVDRVVLSFQHFMGFAADSIGQPGFYPQARHRIGALMRLFAGHEIELLLAIRDPATFLPAVALRQQVMPPAEYLAPRRLGNLVWSDLVRRLAGLAPAGGVIVWRSEDAPVIWGRITRAAAGLAEDAALEGDLDALRALIGPKAARALAQGLEDAGTLAPPERDRLVAEACAALKPPDAPQTPLPGWSEDVAATLGAEYARDIDRIAAMPGVRLVTPDFALARPQPLR